MKSVSKRMPHHLYKIVVVPEARSSTWRRRCWALASHWRSWLVQTEWPGQETAYLELPRRNVLQSLSLNNTECWLTVSTLTRFETIGLYSSDDLRNWLLFMTLLAFDVMNLLWLRYILNNSYMKRGKVQWLSCPEEFYGRQRLSRHTLRAITLAQSHPAKNGQNRNRRRW